jgi:hypothetical protein
MEAKTPSLPATPSTAGRGPVPIDPSLLRFVVGGTSDSTLASPKGTWSVTLASPKGTWA